MVGQMPDISLDLNLFDTRESLPQICISCGKRATSEVEIRTLANLPKTGAAPADSSSLGCLVGMFEALVVGHAAMAAMSRPSVLVPVCRYHRWIVPPATYIKSITERRVELAEVATEFIAQLPKSVK